MWERYSSKIKAAFLLQSANYISWQTHKCVQWYNELNNCDIGDIHDKAVIEIRPTGNLCSKYDEL